MKPKIYVGCSLTQASEEFRTFVEEFKMRLEVEYGFEVLGFIGLENGTSVDVWKHDLKQVQTGEAMISFVDYPSIGLGIELREAMLGTFPPKPILCLARKGTRVTRMLHGAYELGFLRLMEYEDIDHALVLTNEFLMEKKVAIPLGAP